MAKFCIGPFFLLVSFFAGFLRRFLGKNQTETTWVYRRIYGMFELFISEKMDLFVVQMSFLFELYGSLGGQFVYVK